MKIFQASMNVPAVDGDDVWKAESCPKERPGIFAKRMNESIVDAVKYRRLAHSDSVLAPVVSLTAIRAVTPRPTTTAPLDATLRCEDQSKGLASKRVIVTGYYDTTR